MSNGISYRVVNDNGDDLYYILSSNIISSIISNHVSPFFNLRKTWKEHEFSNNYDKRKYKKMGRSNRTNKSAYIWCKIIYLNVETSKMFTMTTTTDTAMRTTTARAIIGSTSRNIDTIRVTTITIAGAANEFGAITNDTGAEASQSAVIQIEMIIFELIARAEWVGILKFDNISNCNKKAEWVGFDEYDD